MASIRLYRREVEEGALPRICMRCGADANAEKHRHFTWYPPWVNLLLLIGVLPAAIVAMVLTKKMHVYAPMCANHKNHWLMRNLVIFGGLVAVIAFGLATTFIVGVISGMTDSKQAGDAAFGIGCAASAVLLLVWLVCVIIAQNTAIRPTEITEKTITLRGVSEQFVAAMDEEERPSRVMQRYDDEDDDDRDLDDRPRRRRPTRMDED
jgi:hypothetical protein